VNLPTARDIIDVVRATTQLPDAHASTNYVVWGFSQGATAAAFVNGLAASYAPELHLDGVVATARRPGSSTTSGVRPVTAPRPSP
jgi:hypothetical protein